MGDATASAVVPSDRFQLGSCTKAMTATLLAVLIGQGTLQWGLCLPQALPSLAARIHLDYAACTVALLACHRSGLRRDLHRRHWPRPYALPVTEARSAVAELLLSSPPLSPPDSQFRYSNVGYIVLGAIMKETTGHS